MNNKIFFGEKSLSLGILCHINLLMAKYYIILFIKYGQKPKAPKSELNKNTFKIIHCLWRIRNPSIYSIELSITHLIAKICLYFLIPVIV